MKILSFIIIITLSKIALCQNIYVGCYERLDSKISINADSTFRFFYSVDTYRAWARGKWNLRGRKIVLSFIPIYDTTFSKIDASFLQDSLVLSRDYQSDRLMQKKDEIKYIFSYGQNSKMCPKMMIYRNGKLYIIEHGKRQKKKIRNGFYIKPFDSFYQRVKCAD